VSETTLPVYYWDACIFLEYIRKEDVTPQKRHAIQRLLRDNKGRENVICTSAISHVECLPSKLSHEDASREKEYLSMFGTRFFHDISITTNTLVLAREIRDYYYVERDVDAGLSHKIMGLGDAIHLATAIIAEIPIFHTRDKKKKGGNVPLIGLPQQSPNGKIAGKYELTIISPEDPQTDIVDLAEEAVREEAAQSKG
jgi:hypothetical protein